jgi:hypothetical protein
MRRRRGPSGTLTSCAPGRVTPPALGLGLALGERLGLTLADGESDADGLTLGDVDALGLIDAEGETLGETDALGLRLGLTDALGLTLAEGERLGLTEADGEMEADGVGLALAEGERLALGEAEAEGEVVPSSNATNSIALSPDTASVGLVVSPVLVLMRNSGRTQTEALLFRDRVPEMIVKLLEGVRAVLVLASLAPPIT